MWKPTAALGLACLLSGCTDWMAGRRDGRLACKITHDEGTFTLLVRENGVERALAKAAPLSKAEVQELGGYTCGSEGQGTPCAHAAYVKDPKTSRWTPYMYAARDANGALLEELLRDLPVVAGGQIIGSEPNPCRLGPAGYFRDDAATEQPSAFSEATFAMTLSGRAFDVPADRLLIALEEGATLDWFRPGSPLPDTRAPADRGAFRHLGLLDVAKLVAWALGVLGGSAVVWDRLARRR